MNKYLIESEGVWNNPHITSETIGDYNGVEPLYNGGCFAIIPHNDKFIIFAEDDDHYWEEDIIDINDLNSLKSIYESLDNDIAVKIDYSKSKSHCYYTISKKDFLYKNRSLGNYKIEVVDRDKSAPLVSISKDKYNDSFAVSHAKDRLNVIINVLKDINEN